MTEEEIDSGCQYLSEQTCLSQDQFEKIVGRSPTFSSIKPVAFEIRHATAPQLVTTTFALPAFAQV